MLGPAVLRVHSWLTPWPFLCTWPTVHILYPTPNWWGHLILDGESPKARNKLNLPSWVVFLWHFSKIIKSWLTHVYFENKPLSSHSPTKKHLSMDIKRPVICFPWPFGCPLILVLTRTGYDYHTPKAHQVSARGWGTHQGVSRYTVSAADSLFAVTSVRADSVQWRLCQIAGLITGSSKLL